MFTVLWFRRVNNFSPLNDDKLCSSECLESCDIASYEAPIVGSISKIYRPVYDILLNFNVDLTFTRRGPWRNKSQEGTLLVVETHVRLSSEVFLSLSLSLSYRCAHTQGRHPRRIANFSNQFRASKTYAIIIALVAAAISRDRGNGGFLNRRGINVTQRSFYNSVTLLRTISTRVSRFPPPPPLYHPFLAPSRCASREIRGAEHPHRASTRRISRCTRRAFASYTRRGCGVYMHCINAFGEEGKLVNTADGNGVMGAWIPSQDCRRARMCFDQSFLHGSLVKVRRRMPFRD